MSTGRRIRANGPVRIDRLAEALLDPLVSKAGFSSTQILAAWPDIVGPALAERSRPEKLRWPQRRDGAGGEGGEGSDGATLVVRAEGGDALELQYASSEIVTRINAIFGWKAVRRVTIRQAPVEPAAGPRTPERAAEPVDNEAIAALQGLDDADLRAALARLGARIAAGPDTKA